MHLIIESVVTLEGVRISGLALMPRISRNGNLYTPNEMARADNKTVPLDWNHDKKQQIGQVTFHYDPELTQLRYEGMVTDDAVAKILRNKKMFVSIEADVESIKDVCDTRTCYRMPLGLEFTGLGIVETPGIPESTLNIIEKYHFIERFPQHVCTETGKCPKCGQYFSSLDTHLLSHSNIHSDITPSKKEDFAVAGPMDSPAVCPNGQHWDNNLGKCISDMSVQQNAKKEDATIKGPVTNTDIQPGECADGFHWDDDLNKCVADDVGVTPNAETAPANCHWCDKKKKWMPNEMTLETYMQEPFAGYTDFADCVSKNSDKSNPQAYCGLIKSKTESIKEADYPWDQCMSDQQAKGHSQDSASRICGSIKAQNQSYVPEICSKCGGIKKK